jgi:hypothetical protein
MFVLLQATGAKQACFAASLADICCWRRRAAVGALLDNTAAAEVVVVEVAAVLAAAVVAAYLSAACPWPPCAPSVVTVVGLQPVFAAQPHTSAEPYDLRKVSAVGLTEPSIISFIVPTHSFVFSACAILSSRWMFQSCLVFSISIVRRLTCASSLAFMLSIDSVPVRAALAESGIRPAFLNCCMIWSGF